jgi:uncharacterized damage-inducible protein DinB
MPTITEISPSALMEFWRDVRRDIRECLKATPDDCFSWAPKEGMLTFGQLYAHLSTAIDWWCTKFIQDSGLWVSADQVPKERASLEQRLLQSFSRVERFAGSADLANKYAYENRTVTGAWILLHLYEHDVHHRAQIKTYLRQNGIAPPANR